MKFNYQILVKDYDNLKRIVFELENLKKRNIVSLDDLKEEDYFAKLCSLSETFAHEMNIKTSHSLTSAKQVFSKLQFLINRANLSTLRNPKSFIKTLIILNKHVKENLSYFQKSQVDLSMIINSLACENQYLHHNLTFQEKELIRHKNEALIYYRKICEIIELKCENSNLIMKELDNQFIILHKLHLSTVSSLVNIFKSQGNQKTENVSISFEDQVDLKQEIQVKPEDLENSMWFVIEGQGGKDHLKGNHVTTDEYLTQKVGEQTIEELKSKMKQFSGPILYKAVDPDTGKVTTSNNPAKYSEPIINKKERVTPIPQISMNSLMSELKLSFKTSKEPLPSL